MARVTLLHQTREQVEAGVGAGTALSTTSHARSFHSVLSDTGSGELALQNTDPLLGQVQYQDFVRFSVDGTPRFLMKVEGKKTHTRARGGRVNQFTQITGRSSLAEWEQAVIYPPNRVFGQPATDTRVYGYPSRELDISAWGSAVEIAQQGASPRLFPPEGWFGAPYGWPDPDGWFIWSQAQPPGGQPNGDVYLGTDFTAPARGRYTGYCAGDNGFKVWIDGVLIAEHEARITGETGGGDPEGYRLPMRFVLELHGGVHRVMVEATNVDDFADMSGSMGGFILALYDQDASGNDRNLLLRSDSSWKALGYPTMPTGVGDATRPTPPGFTAGRVLRLMVEEAQDDENVLLGWSLDFTDTVDSAGNPWPENRSWTFPVGKTTLLAALVQMGETDIDFVPDPAALVLHAYAIETPWSTPAGEATAVLRRLDSLTFTGKGGVTPNTLLVRYKGGYTEVAAQESIDIHGRQKGFLPLDDVESRSEAERLARRELRRLAWPVESIDAEADPRAEAEDDRVFTGWNVGDYVLTFDRYDVSGSDDPILGDENGDPVGDENGDPIGTWGEYRVREISIVEAVDGSFAAVPGLASRVDELGVYLQRTLDRYLALTGGEFSPVARWIPNPNTAVAKRATMTDETFSWSRSAPTNSTKRTPPHVPDLPGRLALVTLRRGETEDGFIPDTEPSVDVILDDVIIATVTIPAGSLEATPAFLSEPFGPTNRLELRETTAIPATGMTAKATQVVYDNT